MASISLMCQIVESFHNGQVRLCNSDKLAASTLVSSITVPSGNFTLRRVFLRNFSPNTSPLDVYFQP